MELVLVLVLVLVSIKKSRSDEICEAVVVDSITTLQNGTIVIFRRNDVWFLNPDDNLLGPCPISSVYAEMRGPIDAAVTITRHDTITEFMGASIYFENKKYFTYKNLGQYEVEWGSLVYLSHTGLQEDIGSTVPKVVDYMKTAISYAYFDPNDGRSKFVFSDGTLLSFNFDMGTQHDIPKITTIQNELTNYGVKDSVPLTLTGAVTLSKDTVHYLYLFNGSNFCSIKLDNNTDEQKCQFRANKEFFNCDKIVRKNGFCVRSGSQDITTDMAEKPINAEVPKEEPKAKQNPVVFEAKPENKIESRADHNSSVTSESVNRIIIPSAKPANSGAHSLATLTELFIFISFNYYIY